MRDFKSITEDLVAKLSSLEPNDYIRGAIDGMKLLFTTVATEVLDEITTEGKEAEPKGKDPGPEGASESCLVPPGNTADML